METQTHPARNSRVGAVLATFGLMWLWALVYIAFTSATGIFGDVDVRETLTTLGAGLYRMFSDAPPESAFDASIWQVWFAACIAAPIIEEVVFRAALCSRIVTTPLGTIAWKDRWLVLAFCGIAFGWAHALFSQSAVFLQGVHGVLLANLWFKNRTGDGLAPYFSVVGAHALYNFSIYASVALLGS